MVVDTLTKDIQVKQAMQNKSTHRPISIRMEHRVREGLLIISAAVAVFLLISFSSYHHADPGWSSTGLGDKVFNLGGRVGAFLADLFLSLFGFLAYLIPPLVVIAAWIGLSQTKDDRFKWLDFWLKTFGFILIVISGCGILALYLRLSLPVSPSAGGILGDITVKGLTHILNVTGSALLLVTFFLCGVTLFMGLSWIGLVDAIAWQSARIASLFKPWLKRKIAEKPKVQQEPVLNVPKIKKAVVASAPIEPKIVSIKVATQPAAPTPKPKVTEKVTSSVVVAPGQVPPLTLLDMPAPSEGKAFSSVSFEDLSNLVEQRLSDFGVEVKVVAVHPGPVVTRFELDLAPGIKVSKISGLAKDIARSLSVSSVRVVEVIPGKSFIGLELPNEHREVVSLREILESQRYVQSRSPVSLALGKDISGFAVVVDLAKMPHLLVAGTTGSGKSVSINAMLLSMLFKATPEQLRLIMIDPKMLELSIYEGIPHLLTPVITDMKDAANALRWCVAEMDRRYRLMSLLGVRNLAGYNIKVTEAAKQGTPIAAPDWLIALGNQPPTLQAMPMIVVVADELADMMMVVGKKVEELVTRIAQKARAAGIHLILATQRPSVDVITGLIKANVPTRIAFQVSSRIDSRTILDQQGAEQLLGNGDMLYLPPGTGVPVRVHGAYVADEEVHRVVAAWQTYGKPTYLEEILEGGGDASGTGQDEQGSGELDALYDDALRIVTESRRASISLVQRRLRIGYNRAARIMEDMEAAGVVSNMDGSGSREVLAPPPVES
jgi:S-DNA-T family DNA segregation ATPase FtsK/SpoIIIE